MEWLGEIIPNNWRTARIKEFLAERKELCDNDCNLDLLSVSEYYGVAKRKNVIKDTDILSRAESVEGYKICHPGDLVMNIMLAWKRATGYCGEDGITSPAYAVYRPTEDVCMKYFHYLFRTDIYAKYFENNSTGIIPSRYRLYPDVFLGLRCHYPPYEIQSRIASFLDSHIAKIDDSIARYKALSDKLDEYRKAVITKAVSKGEYIPIKHLVNYNQETLSESTDKDMIFDYVDIGSVSYEYGIEKRERMVFGSSPSRARRIVHPGDVIVSTVRTYLKAVAQIPEHEVPIIVSTGFIVMSANAKVSKEFLGYALKNEEFIWEVEKNSFGISYPAINSGALVNIKIRIPSKPEQAEIVAYLDKKCSDIDRSKSKIETVIKKLEEYKKSLIYNAVTGKIEC